MRFVAVVITLLLFVGVVSAAAGDTILFEQVNISKNITQVWNNGTFGVKPVVQGVTTTDGIDQSFTPTIDTYDCVGWVASQKAGFAQSFTPTKSQMTGVNVTKAATIGSPTGGLLFSIMTNSSGSPSNTVLASYLYSNSTWNALPNGEVFVPLPCLLTPGSTYWIRMLESPYDTTGSDVYYQIGRYSAGGYTDGEQKYTSDGGSTWVGSWAPEIYFKEQYAKNTESTNITVNGHTTMLDTGDAFGMTSGSNVNTYNGSYSWTGTTISQVSSAISNATQGNAPTSYGNLAINGYWYQIDNNTVMFDGNQPTTLPMEITYKFLTVLPIESGTVVTNSFHRSPYTGSINVSISGDGVNWINTYNNLDTPASNYYSINESDVSQIKGNRALYVRIKKGTTNSYLSTGIQSVNLKLNTTTSNQTVLTYQTGTNIINITSYGNAVSSSLDPSLMANVSLIEGTATTQDLIPNFAANMTTGYPNDYFQFTDLTTDTPTTWNWTFGDSGTSTDQNPVHQYTAVGLYDVALNVTNSTSFDSTTKLNYINISALPAPTVPTFTANKTYTTNPTLPVSFTVTSVAPPRMVSYNLSFGDGTWSNTTSSSFSAIEHTYSSVGVYSPTLYVYNAAGEAHTTSTDMIIISNPHAYLIDNPTIINYGIPSNLTLQLDNVSHVDVVTVNVTYNKTALEVKNVYATPGWSQQNTIGSGFVKINLTKADTSSDVNISAAYIQFNVTQSIGLNASEPINFVAASSGVVPNTSYTSGLYAFNKTYDGSITPTTTAVTQTFNIYRTDTGELLSTVQVTNDYTGVINGSAYTTSGTFTITSSLWGTVNLTSSASAFYANTLYGVEINGGTTNIYMTPYVPDNTVKLNQLYPKEVRFVALDNANGAVIPGIGVTAVSYNATYDGTNWEAKLYGVSSAATSIQDTVMVGTTDAGGSITFPMISSNQYAMSFVTASAGINQSLLVFPLQTEYRVWIDTTGATNNTLSQISGSNLTVSEPNSSYVTLGMNYIDTSGLTENVTFTVTSQSNSTVIYTETITSGIAAGVSSDYTIQNIRGDGFVWKYVAYRSDSSILSQGAGVTMKGPNGVLVDMGLPSTGWYQWISMCCLFMLASLASQRTKQYWALLIPIFAAIFLWFGWFTGKSTLAGIVILCAVLGAIIYMKSSLREKFGIGGPGTMLLNIIVYLMILQACVGFINGLEIWSDAGMTNQAVTPTNAYMNIELTTISNLQGAAGLTGDIIATATIFVDMALTALGIFGFMLFSLITIYPTIQLLFPWMLQSAQTIALFALIQIGIWIMYVLFIYQTWYKPTIGTADF